MKKTGIKVLLTAFILSVGMFKAASIVSAQDYFVTDVDKSQEGNLTYASGVNYEMTQAAYWAARTYTDANKVMMTKSEIMQINQKALNTESTNMYDLENVKENYNATTLRDNLANSEIPNDDVYVNSELVNKEEYFASIGNAILETGYTGERTIDYGICVKSTSIKSWPSTDYVGYSTADTDEELTLSALTVNEPFIIKQKAIVNGTLFYWGYSDMVSGWVKAEDIAIANNKQEWLDAWKVDINSNNFLVVTQDKIVLEPSIYASYSSEVKLKIGTILKLVAEDDMPKNISERGTWNNYVVYLPTRNQDGKLEVNMALISQHCKVSVGFLPMTQANIIEVALECLGNRYGWGGMLDSMDCSLYTRNVYRCFGFNLPRNTNWQRNIPDTCYDLSTMEDAEKQEFLEKMPAGTLLYFGGHTMIYLGSEKGVGYVISDMGTVIDSTGPIKVYSVQGVVINPLTVRRGGKTNNTWLREVVSAVAFAVPTKEDVTPTTEKITTEKTSDSSQEKVLPKTKITKIKVKKTTKISWKKAKGITGYNIQYAKNKKFKKAKNIYVKNSKSSKTMKILKKKKTYYFRIRTYIKKKSKNKVIYYYSDWSKSKRKKI